MSTAGIILIGDEILSGKVQDENARFAVDELRKLGVALRRITVIPDVLDEIAAAVAEFSARYDLVFTSGGVGPTHDDLTMEGVARAFAGTVIRHPLLEQLLRSYYGERLRERDLRMADVPDGAHFVTGDAGPGWPVIAMRNVHILPGVPELFRRKFDSIKERFREAPYVLRVVYTTSEEGLIAGELDRIVASYGAVAVGSYPTFSAPDYKVKLTLESKDAAAVAAACEDLVRALGSAVVRVE
ncbi:MAG TPA: competence/damage-inducible protein A [Polyangia bacterium]|jgi:molybdenum cofactor synthesis domain-containing protein|nr:competence/damage-inducible protein A [Polyangia bacterium]